MYRIIEPEIAGELGRETVIKDKTVHPPIVEKLNYEFNGWLGDDILESFPCYIVTERLRKKIEDYLLTGIEFGVVKTTKSDIFNELYPNKNLPKFYWAKINGEKFINDFAINSDYRLVISEKVFQLFKLFNINNAVIEELKL